MLMTFISGEVKEGGKEFFRYKKGGKVFFFEVKKWGQERFLSEIKGAKSFFWEKKGGLRLLLPVQNSENLASVPYKFCTVPYP